MLWRAIVVLGIAHCAFQLLVVVPQLLMRTDVDRDVTIYYMAAVRLRDGLDVYQLWPDYGVEMTPTRFFYSPIFLLLTRPLAGLDFVNFARLWTLILLVPLWTYAFCLSRLATGKWDWKVALVFGMFVNVVLRGSEALGLGQGEPFMWMMFGLALTTRYRAGWLALATLIKIHPIWSLGLTLARGGKNAWKDMALFAIPVVLFSWWLVGTHNWLMWLPATRPVASQGTFFPYNLSLSFLGLRIFHWCGLLEGRGSVPGWGKMYLAVCAAGAPLGTAWLTRNLSKELQLGLVASAGVLFSPLFWGDYSPLFALPLAVWLGERRVSQHEAAPQ